MAYGTETIPAVDVIVGPGNKFVAAAKKEVFGKVGIDMVAGPTEVLVIADDSANPAWVAADLLAQAEHDVVAQPVLVTDSAALAEKVSNEIEKQLKTLKTAAVARESIDKCGLIILVENLEDAAEIANLKAPEHLELFVKNAEDIKDKFTNYGSIFIGRNCAEVFGDYCSGTNHVLPTNCASKYTGGLSVFDYVKILSYQCLNQKYALQLSKTASTLAAAEGLFAHKLASDLRGK